MGITSLFGLPHLAAGKRDGEAGTAKEIGDTLSNLDTGHEGKQSQAEVNVTQDN